MANATATPGTAAEPIPTDALLVQLTLPAGAQALLPALLQHLHSAAPHADRPVHAALSKDHGTLYAYLHFDKRTPVEKSAANALATSLRTKWPLLQDVRVSRLEQVFAIAGASASAKTVFHYTVEMDPESGWMPELSEWYDTEHMPGLATVPGCVSASRFLNHDHGPLSLACYDLVTEETLGSPPWLAIRGTEWSSRMRPRFTNTIRTMFTLLLDSTQRN
ncbi:MULTISPECIES: hypothetical protein [Polaromonas]|uniref:ABM domain-containing protein n=1 Tax=Polaromonas aquatica TaxID=332657 RepID=A0ABW1TSG8_9BURK